MTWQQFVLEHGWYAHKEDLARVLEQPADAIEAFRRHQAKGACKRRPRALDFGELFALWHGRPPAEEEWPAPRQRGNRPYDWLQPELTLLAKLMGTMSVDDIATFLTTRLQQLTGDATAIRNRNSIQVQVNRIGLQTSDFVGGMTTTTAGKRVGSLAVVQQAIHSKKLRTFRIGKRHVIPFDEFDRWMATRETPPDGWVTLSSLRVPLGISSDSKLPEYAALGYIPHVRQVQGISCARGVWYIAPEQAQQILEDASAGRPMPWHGKPLLGNQESMWKKWQLRKHRWCRTCTGIWKGHVPKTFEDFCAQYGTLTVGQKRHLTIDRSKPRTTAASRPHGSVRRRMLDAGVTIYEAAALLQQRSRWIRGWIRVGLLNWGGVVRDELGGEAIRITPLGLEQLRAAAADEAAQKFRLEQRLGMGVHQAAQHVGVSIATVGAWHSRGLVLTKQGPRGLLFERTSLEQQARRYWAWAVKRYKRATPPAWLQEPAA
jgi:hypothetical protein